MKKSGDYTYYQLCFIPLRDTAGKPTGVVADMKHVDNEARKEMKDRRKLETDKYAHVAKRINVDSLLETMKALAR